jgi:hypothetical protein
MLKPETPLGTKQKEKIVEIQEQSASGTVPVQISLQQ